MERFFFGYEDVIAFCTELKNSGSEGLCSCVCEGVVEALWDKVELGFRMDPLQSDCDLENPR
jgi:hypothetical protein